MAEPVRDPVMGPDMMVPRGRQGGTRRRIGSRTVITVETTRVTSGTVPPLHCRITARTRQDVPMRATINPTLTQGMALEDHTTLRDAVTGRQDATTNLIHLLVHPTGSHAETHIASPVEI